MLEANLYAAVLPEFEIVWRISKGTENHNDCGWLGACFLGYVKLYPSTVIDMYPLFYVYTAVKLAWHRVVGAMQRPATFYRGSISKLAYLSFFNTILLDAWVISCAFSTTWCHQGVSGPGASSITFSPSRESKRGAESEDHMAGYKVPRFPPVKQLWVMSLVYNSISYRHICHTP